jgi:hypothetical protein
MVRLDDKLLALLRKHRKELIKLLRPTGPPVKTFSEEEKKAYEKKLLEERERKMSVGLHGVKEGDFEEGLKQAERIRRIPVRLDRWVPPEKKPKKEVATMENLFELIQTRPGALQKVLKFLEDKDNGSE